MTFDDENVLYVASIDLYLFIECISLNMEYAI